MALAFQELIVEQGQANAGPGSTPGSVSLFSDTRRFQVPGDTPAQAAMNQELRDAAGAGTVHPTIPNLISVGYQIGQRIGAGDNVGYYATAAYAQQGAQLFQFPPPDRQSLQFVSASVQPFEKAVDFPIYCERTIAAPSGSGGSTSKEWVKVENKSIVVKCLALQIEFNMTTLSASEVGAMYAQMNKIHTFYGGDWLFKPLRADKLYREGVWNVSFRWESDPGTSATDLQEFDDDPIFCEIAPRLPHALWYEVFDVVYPETDSGPRLVSKGMNTRVPAGYQTLPGYGSAWNL